MSDIVIKVENLGKKYHIRHEQRERYTALHDVVARGVRGFGSSVWGAASKLATDLRSSASGNGAHGLPTSDLRPPTSDLPGPSPLPLSTLSDSAPSSLLPASEEFWALKDVSFEVKQAEVVGIIGRNGAGKSTLLKILSRITEPTEGRVRLRGRVASLLEVGTGFHPELTGRENIFLNGAILGMNREEIKRKFDEIVAFADVDQFLDTPVKRYSSGMYVRLAFSVAAHLEPEILVVDEVLAVGDAQFQKKCLSKMEDVSTKEGRTVLFVSHNMSAIKTLCTAAIVMKKGEKIFQGDVFDSLTTYIAVDQTELDNRASFVRQSVPVGQTMFIQRIDMVDDQSLSYFCLRLSVDVQSHVNARIGINIRLKDGMGFPVAAGFTHCHTPDLHSMRIGANRLEILTEKIYLAIGSYKLSVELVVPGHEYLDTVEDGIRFELTNDGVANRHYGIVQSWGYGAHEIKFQRIQSV